MTWILPTAIVVLPVLGFFALVFASAARLRSQARRHLEDLEQMRAIRPQATGASYEEGA